VIHLLQEAARRIRVPERHAQFATLEGWYRPSKTLLARCGRVKIPEETALSEAIVDEIEHLREDILLKIVPAPADIFDLNALQFSLEAPRRRKKGLGRHAKPTDIRVYRLGSEIIDLRIEAKVLVKDGDLQKSYLSTQGLKRFSDPEEPYTEQEIGGMLAYTVTDDGASWLAKIESALRASTPPVPTFRQKIHRSLEKTLFCRVPYGSDPRTRIDVLVFHLVLEFDSDPPAR
jgi:hypothetical protein